MTLKMGDLAGTRKVVAEIYDSFTKFGTKSFLLWNRIAWYCVPHNVLNDMTPHSKTTPIRMSAQRSLLMKQQATETNMENLLASEPGMEVISAIPCYCDIQFSRKQPGHPFAKQFEQLVHAVETI